MSVEPAAVVSSSSSSGPQGVNASWSSLDVSSTSISADSSSRLVSSGGELTGAASVGSSSLHSVTVGAAGTSRARTGSTAQSPSPTASTTSSPAVSPALFNSSVPVLTTQWSSSQSCPQLLGRNDVTRGESSPCWYLEWFPLYAAALQSAAPLQGAPAMEGNWSTLVSNMIQQWIVNHGYTGQCDDNPMVYPLMQQPGAAQQQRQAASVVSATTLIYADSQHGSDVTGNGSISNPLLTLQEAVAMSRRRAAGSSASIVLRQGAYYLNQTLQLNQPLVDSNLTIMAQPSENVQIIGGIPFTPQWSSWTPLAFTASGQPAYVTAIPSWVNTSWSSFNELMINGSRQVRARYPNGDSFINVMGDYSWQIQGATWASLMDWSTATVNVAITGVRDNYNFNDYLMGFNGSAAPYINQQNYWSQTNPNAGENRGQYSSFTFSSSTFPNVGKWTQVESTYAHAPQVFGWGSWQFQLSVLNLSSLSVNVSRGAFQESRGTNYIPVGIDTMFIDHQLAELDVPGEFYIDAGNALLYWMANASTPLPTEVVASQMMTLISISGGVANVSLQGLTFTHSTNSFMAPHMTSGGGDWANTPEAAVHITDCTNCSVSYCLFTQLGGNGVVVDGASNGTFIAFSEFSYLGANAIAVMGTMLGYNATLEWAQPRDTLVQSNLLHDVGKYNKQSGALYNTLAYRTVMQGNVVSTTPRSGVNFNDGFAGGHVFAYNLLINTGMETWDVGPYNSWNRVPYYFISSVTGQGSWNTDLSYNHHNLIMVDNENAAYDDAGFDHDDGSTAFVDYENVLINSRTKLFLGTNVTYAGNVIFPLAGSACWWFPTVGPHSSYQNNRCVQINAPLTTGYGYDLEPNSCFASDLQPSFPVTNNNSYFLPAAYNSSATLVVCNNTYYSLSTFQAIAPAFAEPNSHVAAIPSSYPYYRFEGTAILGLSDYVCFNNPANAAANYSSSLYLMPLQANLTESSTGLSGSSLVYSSGASAAAVFSTSTARGSAWLGQGSTLLLLPLSIGFLTPSYSALFWVSTAPTEPYATVFLSSPTKGTAASFVVQVTGDYILGFSHGSAASCLCEAQLTAAQVANTWLHVAVVFDSATSVASLYANGELLNETSNNPSWPGAERLQVGYLDDVSYPITGSMQFLGWAHVALNSSQIGAAYAATLHL